LSVLTLIAIIANRRSSSSNVYFCVSLVSKCF